MASHTARSTLHPNPATVEQCALACSCCGVRFVFLFSLNLVRKLSCTSFLSLFHVIFCIFSTFVSDILCPIGRTRSQTKRLKVSITAGFVTGRVVLDLCTLMARREARYRGRGVPYEIQGVGQLFISTMRKVTGSRSID